MNDQLQTTVIIRIEHPRQFQYDLENNKKSWSINQLVRQGFTFSVITNDEEVIYDLNEECKFVSDKRLVVIDYDSINKDIKIIFDDYTQSKIFPPLTILKLFKIVTMVNQSTIYHNYLKITGKNNDILFYGLWSTHERHIDNIEYFYQKLRSEWKKPKKQIIKRDPIHKALRHEALKRANYRCQECGKTKNNTTLHIDHIKPVSQGGTNTLDNFQVLCEECNIAKFNRYWEAGK